MPRLLAYLPCEKVSIEQGSANVSIISLLDTLNISVPGGSPAPPPGTAVGMNWTIFTLWLKEAGDTDFEQKSTFWSPAGELLFEALAVKCVFEPGKPRFQAIEKIVGFPIWTPGTCSLKLMVKFPTDSEFREFTSTILVLNHVVEASA